jgi:4-amino-4-deoxy-L-arabinose transferase-like glycosyltransferase
MPPMSHSLTAVAPRDLSSRLAAILLLLIALLAAERIAAREWLGLGLHFDEAQYALWSLEPALGYFSKPPLVAWAIAAARQLCGDADLCLRVPSALALALASWFVFLTGRRLFDTRTAFAAALLLWLSPLVSFLSWFITTDSLLIAAWAGALYALVRALQAHESGASASALRWWLLTGAIAGAGLLAKYTMGIFALSAAGYLLSTRAHRSALATPGPWLGAMVAAIIFAPNLLWNAQHRFATFAHTAEISNLDDASLGFGRLAEFLGAQVGVFGPVAMLALLAAALAVLRAPAPAGDGPRPQALLLWFTLPFLAIIAAQALAARAHANWAAPAYVAASLLAAAWMMSLPRARTWLAAAVAVNVAVMLMLQAYRPLTQVLVVRLKKDPMTQLEGWDAAGRAVANALAAQPDARLLFDDRRAMSLLGWYAGLHEPRARHALIWNPEGRIDNHYQLLRDARQAPAGPFLFVSERDHGSELAAAFDSVTPLGVLSASATRVERPLHAWRLGAIKAANR